MSDAKNDHPRVIALPPILYLVFLLIGLGLHLLWPVRVVPGSVRFLAGGGLFVLGAILGTAAMREFRALGTNVEVYRPATALATGGPYRFSRNPMYVGLTLAYAGIGIAANTLSVLVLLIPLLALMRYGVIAREEAYLERKFEDAYRRYKASARRWL